MTSPVRVTAQRGCRSLAGGGQPLARGAGGRGLHAHGCVRRGSNGGTVLTGDVHYLPGSTRCVSGLVLVHDLRVDWVHWSADGPLQVGSSVLTGPRGRHDLAFLPVARAGSRHMNNCTLNGRVLAVVARCPRRPPISWANRLRFGPFALFCFIVCMRVAFVTTVGSRTGPRSSRLQRRSTREAAFGSGRRNWRPLA